MGLAMASYQNPQQSADSLPPSSLNWGDSLEAQDEPAYSHAPMSPFNPPFSPPVPDYGQAPEFGPAAGYPPVQHAIQPHPFAEPQPYPLAAPPLHDAPPAGFNPGLSYGYGAQAYTGPEPGESGKARAALWIGILGGWLPINLVVGIAALAETGPGRKRGRDKAIIGLCCSLVWVTLIGGVAFALHQHVVEAVPQAPQRTTLSARSDPGCYAGANAVYAYQGTKRQPAAQSTLGKALIKAADKSQNANAPLRKLGLDYLALAAGATVPSLAADTAQAGSACGLSFKVD